MARVHHGLRAQRRPGPAANRAESQESLSDNQGAAPGENRRRL